jgi:hypothetical protein
MDFLKKYWPTIVAAVGAAVPFLMPSLLAYVSAHPHTAVGVLLAAFIAAYHSTAPKDQNQLKAILIAVCLLGFCAPAVHAQEAPLTNIYAAGVSFNNSGSPSIAGTGLYARLLSDASGTYAFTAVDALPNTLKPFTVTTNFSGGVAQKVFTIGKIPIFVPTAAGVSYSGSNVGWAWSTGALASIKLKGNFRIFPTVRIAKSSVSNGTGYQPIVGVLFGWGQ